MKKTNKYIAVLTILTATSLLSATIPSVKVQAAATNRSLRALTDTPWIGPSIDSGKLRYGISEGRVQTGTKVGVGIPNVEYMENASINIRHVFDYREGATINYRLRTTPAFNIIETEDEYTFDYGLPLQQSGMASFTNSQLVGANEVVGTGSKYKDDKMAIKVNMKANAQQTAVSHIYTITNNDSKTRTVYPIKYVDTQLNMNDYVPVYSRGAGEGLYIESSANPADPAAKWYRLDYIMDVENGPEIYKGADQGYSFAYTFGPDMDNQDKSGMNAAEGEIVFGSSDASKKMDTSIYMSWGKKTLAPGESVTMRYDVGIRPIANLENSVSVTNLTRTDGKNYVGDEIEYAVKVKSPKDNFYGIKITDELSWYFENPTAPITVVDDQGVESTYALKDVYKANTSPSATDPKVGTFTIPAGVVGGGKEITIKIKSKIAHPAAGQEIDNLANISGKSEEESLVNEDVKPDSTLLVENAAPEIIGADDFEMDKGEDFDELAGITVKDMEDGDLTSKVSVEGFVNTSKKGQYSVTYTVTDSHGNVTTKTIIVSVV
ncbi:DUF5011 domain-containing protein [Vagococcus sp. BWB3-3]|uniref:DUF5011 domain-containing protein n=1 Tax=Vagococcus allomyrinae TaxID=2794353 RepID=A0A940P4A5_9ENTE|nr:DUF5011 domain-containing protein [Vagococcus allomyrinae]